MLRELQNSIWKQIRAFCVVSDFSQIAYTERDMSICEKPNRHKNHQICPPKRVLQFPLALLVAGSSLINLSSSQLHEYPIQYFVEDLRYVFSEHAPFAEEFLPYIEGGIDVIGFFAAQADETVQANYLKLKEDFINFRMNPSLLDTLITDCKQLFSFPRLRFSERISAFEEATAHLELCAGVDLSSSDHEQRVYIYGAAKALNEIHEELCDYICTVYDNTDWEDYFDFEDLEMQAHDFLLNPTLRSQLELQIMLSLLKAKIHNL